MKFSRSDFEMQRFESRRPNRPVSLERIRNLVVEAQDHTTRAILTAGGRG